MINGFREPHMCGADDCIKCFPENFRNGYYIFQACKECQSECHIDELEDGICNDCKCRNWLEENGISHSDAEILIELLKYAEFINENGEEFTYQSED
jgi:hypothetical protein